jgi:VWFA-related protein
LLSLVIPGRFASGQQATPTLTANARIVVLDVVATGRDGKPLVDLTAKDFQVYESGALQRIGSFEGPDGHGLPPKTEAAGVSAVFDPAQPAAFGQSPVDIFVLDQSNTHFADSGFAHRSLHDFIARQPNPLPQPSTLLAVYDGQFRQIQGFTRDRDMLLHTLDATPNKYAWKLETQGKAEYGPVDRLDQSLRALEQMAQSFARIPGRKSLIWLGAGFPTVDPTVLTPANAREIKQALRHITGALLDARIVLYAVDPTSSAAGMTEVTDASQMDFVQDAGDALGSNADPFGATDDFDKLGPASGGRVIRGNNAVAARIADSVDLGAHFYTLAYTPSSTSEAAAQFRSIKVVCLRAGCIATTHTGYYSGKTEGGDDAESVSQAATYDLTTAAEASIPLYGLRVAVERNRSTAQDAFLVHVAASTLTWKPNPDGGATASVYVMAVALDKKNQMIAHTLRGMTANARAGANLADPALTADFQLSASPAPKAAVLRFIVRDSATGRMGSFDLSLKSH